MRHSRKMARTESAPCSMHGPIGGATSADRLVRPPFVVQAALLTESGLSCRGRFCSHAKGRDPDRIWRLEPRADALSTVHRVDQAPRVARLPCSRGRRRFRPIGSRQGLHPRWVKIRLTGAKIFPFDQIVEAHRFLESNDQVGKIIVTI